MTYSQGNNQPDEDQLREAELSEEAREIASRRQQAAERARVREYNHRATSLHVDAQTLGFPESQIVSMELKLRQGDLAGAERMVAERKADDEARRAWLNELDKVSRGAGSYAEAERLKSLIKGSPWVDPPGFKR